MGEEHRMTQVVFFQKREQFSQALQHFSIDEFRGQELPLKLHMGEINNKYFPRPELVQHVVATLQSFDMKPYLFDSTVAYSGLRHTKTGYQKVAQIHGFAKDKMGCSVVIDDTGIPITIDNREYEVAEHLHEASHIFALSHVKGHIATGMGGAIKNFGMGGVTKETKQRMHHGSRPQYQRDACTFCGVCAEVCPFDAIEVNDSTWHQNMKSCFGCGVCVDSCTSHALIHKDVHFQYALACAAKACLQGKHVLYFNEVKRISRSCDCDPQSGPIICPDIGFLVSDDPVAIDKASLDLIEKEKPHVFEQVNHVNPYKQIQFGEEIGLGSSSYELVTI
jgi:uncharacterized Fe-S center protein